MHRLLLIVLLFAGRLLPAQISLVGENKTWAVIAGISTYQHKEIEGLQFAHADARAFYNYLVSPAGGNVPASQIQLLLNEAATTASFAAALDWLIEKAAEGDKVFIYFSGHGDVENKTIGQHGFLLTWNSPPRSYIAGAYPLFYLQSVISTLSLQNKSKVIMIADACRAGKLAGASIQGPQVTAANLQKQYANEVKLLACGSDEFSVEGEQWGGGRGAFSYHLIDGLTGLADKDANFDVSLFEIRRYLEDKVPVETAPNNQNPLAVGDRNVSIALVDPPTLAQLQKEKTSHPVVFDAIATRGLETLALSQTDTLGRELLEAFQRAIADKRLLDPENHSAWHYFQQLSQRSEFQSIEAALRRNLSVALQDDAQQAVNAYLNADPREMARRWQEGPQAYAHIPAYLEKSAELLGPGHYMTPSLRARQRYFEAMLLRMEGGPLQLNEALLKIEEAIALEPVGAHLFNEKGLIYSGLGQPEAEINAYRKARQLAPAWAMPVYNQGISYREQNILDSALMMIKIAISLKEDFPEAYAQLGHIQLLTGNVQEAETAFLNSLQWDQPEVSYGLGNIYLKTDRPELARDMFVKTVRLDPRHPYAHYALGIALKRTGEREKALEAFQENLKANPAYLEPYYSIALLFAEQNDNGQALQWLEKALEKGFTNQNKIMEDPAFEKIREIAAFQQLIARYFPDK